jgi:AbrB family looped-hinge helix DNA binding protein
MSRSIVSSKYQIVIPKDVRESASVEVGQEMEIVAKGGVITLVPVRDLESMRGFLKGMKVTRLREKKDRL